MQLRQLQKVLRIFPQIVELILQVFWIVITLGWRVRKARKAFEKELILCGIAKKDAERLSKQIEVLKDRIMSSVWQSAFR